MNAKSIRIRLQILTLEVHFLYLVQQCETLLLNLLYRGSDVRKHSLIFIVKTTKTLFPYATDQLLMQDMMPK